MTTEDDRRRSFVYQSVERFSSWIEFADAKAGGALILLALGFADLISNARRLVDAHMSPVAWGCIATVAFWAAAGAAILTVWNVWSALFPAIKPAQRSLFYFGDVGDIESSEKYLAEIKSPSIDLDEQVGSQAWQLGRIAAAKFKFVRRSYMTVGAFLILWAIARFSLSLTTPG